MKGESTSMQSDSLTVVEIPCEDRGGEDIYQANLLREFDKNLALDSFKIRDLWAEFRKHDVLFSDYTAGQLLPFVAVLLDPRGVWLEVVRKTEPERPVGVAYITAVKPGHEADAHFAFWDSRGRGREPLVLFLAEWVMDRYHLHRLNAAVPAYQHGVLRFTERLGFRREGAKREAVLYKGSRGPLILFGILRDEVDQQISDLW